MHVATELQVPEIHKLPLSVGNFLQYWLVYIEMEYWMEYYVSYWCINTEVTIVT
jgi:hypothetical protein